MLRLPLHDWHVAHGAQMRELDGWQIPISYANNQQGAAGLRLTDLSALAKVSVRGRGVPNLARGLAADSPAANFLGVTKLADVLACRLTEDNLLLLSNAPHLELRVAGLELRASALKLEFGATDEIVISNVTPAYAGIGLVGDALAEMFRRLTALDVASLPADSCAQTNVAGIHTLLVRMGRSDSMSLQMYVTWEFAEYMWETLLEAGNRWKIAPIGLEGWGSRSAR